MALRSPDCAAVASASAAASGVANDCWAAACDASAKAASVTARTSLPKHGRWDVFVRVAIMIMLSSSQLLMGPSGGGNARARSDPLIVGLELDAELIVPNAQIAVVGADHCIRSDELRLLRHDADIGLVAAVVAEGIDPKAFVEMTEQHDVVLQRDVGGAPPAPASAAPASTTTHAATTSGAHAAATPAAH